MHWIRSILLFLAAGAIAAAQPQITAVQDAAGYASVITRGAMVLVTGAGLGPAYVVQTNKFPMPTTLSGVSMQITVGNTITAGIPFYVWSTQAAFILPSATPAGNGLLTYTFNSQSISFPVTVVNRNPQIYTMNSRGFGPAVITFSPNTNLLGNGFITPFNAIQPNEVAVLYMQGLGPVTFDETQGALPVSLAAGVQLTVGGVQVDTLYLGRQPVTSTSVDVAIFRWPSGIEQSCAVPISVQIGDRISNAVTAPSTLNGRTCSSPSIAISGSGGKPTDNGKGTDGGKGTSGGKTPNTATREDTGTFESLFSTNDFNNWLTDDSANGGIVTFHSTRSTQLTAVSGQAPEATSSSRYSASGDFYQIQAIGQADIVDGVRSLAGGRIGQCSAVTYQGTEQGTDVPGALDPNQYNVQSMDVGNLMASGSFGQRTFEKLSASGNIAYSMELNQDPLLGGPITIANTGSADVSPFSGSSQSPGAFEVTNLEALQNLDRSNITVNWTPLEGGVVIINGSSNIGGTGSGTTKEFTCVALASAGTFTVPANIGNHLDPTDGFTGGNLSVTYSFLTRVPSNLDFVLLELDDSVEQSADYN